MTSGRCFLALIKYRQLNPEQTRELQRLFLEAYVETGQIRRAAEMVGIAGGAHYWWKNDIEYAQQFMVAKQMVADRLEDEAFRRAHDGVERPIFQRGELVGHTKEYSDTLLMFLLKGARPEKYRENISVRTDTQVEKDIAELEKRLRERGLDPDQIINAMSREDSA